MHLRNWEAAPVPKWAPFVRWPTLFVGLFLLFWAVNLMGCAQQPQDNRVRLAQTEATATAAFKEISELVRAGVIRPGSRTAIIIADAELVVAAAIRVWRTNPDNPKYADAAINALPALLQLIANAKSQRTVIWRNYQWAVSSYSSVTCQPSSRPSASDMTCISRLNPMMATAAA